MQKETFKDKFKSAFSKSTIDNVTKMYIFNFAQTKNSIIFWFFWSLFLISQPILSLTFYFIDRNAMLDYSLLITLVPLIFGFIFSTVLIYLLFQDNKTNSIEMKLVCSKFTRKQVLISRLFYIITAIFINLIGQDLFLIMYPIVDMMKFGLTLFIANTFITPFILILLVFGLVMLTYKFNKIVFILLSIVVCILTLGLSLITRPFINTDSYMKYNKNDLVFYSKLTDANNNDIVLANTNDLALESNDVNLKADRIIHNINWNNWQNNLIFSEWTLSFYQSLFADMKFGVNINNAPYNLLKVNVTDEADIDKLDINTTFLLRANDFDFTKLNSSNYKDVLMQDISKIIKKYDLTSSQSKIFIFLDQIQNTYQWSDLKDGEFKSFLMDASGINTNYNQLFYFIKYNDQLSKKIPNLYSTIASEYNNEIATLFRYLFTSEETNHNLFKVNNILGTTKTIDDFYPMMNSVNKTKPIVNTDKVFFKDRLIKFSNENGTLKIMYLKADGTYDWNDIDGKTIAQKLQELDPSIVDYQTWCNYIDNVSVNYATTMNFYERFQALIPNIDSGYELSKNSIDTSSAIVILKPYYSAQIQAAPLFISIYILLIFVTGWLTFKKYKKAKII